MAAQRRRARRRPAVTRELVERLVDEEIAKLPGDSRDYAVARAARSSRSRGRRVRRVPDPAGVRADALGAMHALGLADRPRLGRAGRRGHHRPAAAAHLRVRRPRPLQGRCRRWSCSPRPPRTSPPSSGPAPRPACRSSPAAPAPACPAGALPHADGVLIVTSRMRTHPRGRPRQPAGGRRAGRDQPAGDPRRSPPAATTTRPTRPASRSARSAATSRRTPAARTA